jgi:glutamine synthetase
MAKTLIYPATISYINELASASSGMKDLGITLDNETAKLIATEANALMAVVAELSAAMQKEDFNSIEEHMQYAAITIRGLMEKVRVHADTLESEVADVLWPLPKYQEMLFMK